MQLSAPTNLAFYLALLLFVLGLLAAFEIVAALATYATWLLIGSFVVLALGNLLKGF